jgi:hypothetical protein
MLCYEHYEAPPAYLRLQSETVRTAAGTNDEDDSKG